ncbi:MAG: hypothetical protein JNJ89_02645 [Rubrivivax sp.]|nr:hypothetical protein [Rubrivivax sp.]
MTGSPRGANDAGQVGDGTLVDRTLPVAALGGRSTTQIVAGLGRTCALDAGGVATCWGAAGRIGRASAAHRPRRRQRGRPGDTRRRGRRAALRANRGRRLAHLRHRQRRADVVLGRQLTRAVRRRHLASSQLPVRIAGLPAFTQITAGGGHTCDATAAGAVWCWGADTYGQSGRLL